MTTPSRKLTFRECAAFIAKHDPTATVANDIFARHRAVEALKTKLAAVPPAAASAAPAKATQPAPKPSPLPAAKPLPSTAGPVRPAPVAAGNPAPAPSPETIGRQVATAFVYDSTKTFSPNLAAVEDLAETAALASGQSVWQARCWARFEFNSRRRNSK
jgi:hypothetical protein